MSAFWKFRQKWLAVVRCALIAIVGLGMSLSRAGAQQTEDTKARELAEMKARIDRLEQELLQQRSVQPAPAKASNWDDVKKAAEGALKEQEDKKKADEAQKKQEAAVNGYEVGSNPKMTGDWRTNGLIFESANNDFRAHIGGRTQFDSVFFKQPGDMHGASPGGNTGVLGSSGVGNLDDGMAFRRVRAIIDGQAYETIEYAFIPEFAGLNNVFFDEMWAGVKDVPFLGTIRVGQYKTPMGLESYSSSGITPLLERSPLFDTFWQEFVVGIFVTNTALNQRLTWQYQFGRTMTYQANDGADFGDGNYVHTARITLLPIWECNGREYLHLGASYQFRTGDLGRDSGFPGTGTGGFNDTIDLVRFRTRLSQRDAVSTNGGSTFPGSVYGDGTRVIDTGNIIAEDGVHTLGAELLWNMGSFWVQSEYTAAMVPNARYPATTAGFNAGSRGTPYFWGAYFMAGYFLTGETRGYDRRLGRYDKVIPNENFFAVKTEDDRFGFGSGAWEIVYRYAFVDLDSKGINGGQLGEHTVGLNWYLSPALKFQIQYGIGDRNVPAPAVSGPIQFVGIRAQLDF